MPANGRWDLIRRLKVKYGGTASGYPKLQCVFADMLWRTASHYTKEGRLSRV